MSMIKHSNTFFPGDRVTKKGDPTKVGRVGGSSSLQAGDRIEIEWPSGETTEERPDDLLPAN